MRFRIVNYLVDEGTQSTTGLTAAFDLELNTSQFCLDTLVDVGLVGNYKRKEPTGDGLYS